MISFFVRASNRAAAITAKSAVEIALVRLSLSYFLLDCYLVVLAVPASPRLARPSIDLLALVDSPALCRARSRVRLRFEPRRRYRLAATGTLTVRHFSQSTLPFAAFAWQR